MTTIKPTEYLFGDLVIDGAPRPVLRVKFAGSPEGAREMYAPGARDIVIHSYPDTELRDSFTVEKLYHEETDSAGNLYLWWLLRDYYRNVDHSPAALAGVTENRSGINRNSANIDYVAMMADINIPTESAMSEDAEISTADRMANYAPSGIDGPDMMDAAAHSPKFERVKGYYDAGLWNAEMVHNAVGRWITSAEEQEILEEVRA